MMRGVMDPAHMRMNTVAMAAALCFLSACGGSSPAAPPAPTRTAIAHQTFSGVGALTEFVAAFQVSASGELDVTVDWTAAANDINVFITSNDCPSALNSVYVSGDPRWTRCTLVGRADTTTKPERLTTHTDSGSYKLWIVNLGPGTESGTVDMGLTR